MKEFKLRFLREDGEFVNDIALINGKPFRKENPINKNVVAEIKEIKEEIKNDEVKVAHNKLKIPTQKTKSQKEFFKVTKENHFADNKL